MTNPSNHPVVLAFGGNTLLPDPFHPEEQDERAAELAHALTLLEPEQRGLVLVHGNGPQVGMILLRVETSREKLPREPLDVLVAETQGSVGFLLSRALHNAFTDTGASTEVAAVLTQVVVDPDDPGFARPTKPVGPFYEPGVARELKRERGWDMVEVEGSGWRRVVPSPRPREIVELSSIREAARPGRVVVAGGGGGVPVRRDERGHLHGVEAVLDKDRTSALLALSLEAERFVVLTGVAQVAVDYGRPTQRGLDSMTVGEARDLLAAGQFPPGSMGPKVEAAADYVERSGQPALITDMAHLARALEGSGGTWVEPRA